MNNSRLSKAVQTLSLLNRAHPQKHDCFVLDFQNNSDSITFAFQDYYRTTLLAEETDPNKLHDLKAALEAAQVYRRRFGRWKLARHSPHKGFPTSALT